MVLRSFADSVDELLSCRGAKHCDTSGACLAAEGVAGITAGDAGQHRTMSLCLKRRQAGAVSAIDPWKA